MRWKVNCSFTKILLQKTNLLWNIWKNLGWPTNVLKSPKLQFSGLLGSTSSLILMYLTETLISCQEVNDSCQRSFLRLQDRKFTVHLQILFSSTPTRFEISKSKILKPKYADLVVFLFLRDLWRWCNFIYSIHWLSRGGQMTVGSVLS